MSIFMSASVVTQSVLFASSGSMISFYLCTTLWSLHGLEARCILEEVDCQLQWRRFSVRFLILVILHDASTHNLDHPRSVPCRRSQQSSPLSLDGSQGCWQHEALRQVVALLHDSLLVAPCCDAAALDSRFVAPQPVPSALTDILVFSLPVCT